MNNHQNKVELIGYYGNDQVHACSAWTSTSRDLNEDKINRIPKLLKMLADAGHHTPFEKSALHFLWILILLVIFISLSIVSVYLLMASLLGIRR